MGRRGCSAPGAGCNHKHTSPVTALGHRFQRAPLCSSRGLHHQAETCPALGGGKSPSKEGLGDGQCCLSLQEGARLPRNSRLSTSNSKTRSRGVNCVALDDSPVTELCRGTRGSALSGELLGTTSCGHTGLHPRGRATPPQGRGVGRVTRLCGTEEPQTGTAAQTLCNAQQKGRIHLSPFKTEISHNLGSSTRFPDFGWMSNDEDKAFSGRGKLKGAETTPVRDLWCLTGLMAWRYGPVRGSRWGPE